MSESETEDRPGLLFGDVPRHKQQRKKHYRTLTHRRQPILNEIVAHVAAGDLDALRRLRDGDGDVTALLNTNCQPWSGEDLGEPFKEGDRALVHAMRALACLGAGLLLGHGAREDLRAAVRWYAAAKTSLPSSEARLRELAATRPDGRLGEALEELAAIAAEPMLDGPAMVAAVTLVAMAEPALFRHRRTAPGFEVGVLFAGGGGGQRGMLRVRLVEGLPTCVIPDPLTMTLFSCDGAFRRSLSEAWRQAEGDTLNGAVLWSVQTADSPATRINGESLGGALTVSFNETRRRRRRPMSVFRAGARRRTAIVGRVDGAELLGVGGYHDKLTIAGTTGRVIVPADDEEEARAHVKGDTEVVPVETWADAAGKARKAGFVTWTYRGAGAVSVLLTVVLLWSYLAVDDAKRRRVAARVAAVSGTIGSSDPSLAALLALAAYRLDDSDATVTAMTRVSQDSTLIARKISAHAGGVTALGQAQGSTTLYSAGQDGTIAAWDMRDGRLLARVRHPDAVIGRIVVHPQVPVMVTADERGGVQMWNTADGRPLSGPSVLAEGDPSEARDDGSSLQPAIAVGFLGAGSRAYAVTGDGRIRIWDTVSHDLLTDTSLGSFAGMPASTTQRTVRAVETEALAIGQAAAGDTIRIVTGLGEILQLDLGRKRATLVTRDPRLAKDVKAIAARPNEWGGDGGRDGRLFAIGTGSGVFLWDATTNTEVPSTMGIVDSVTDLRFGPDGDTLVIGTRRGVAVARATVTGEEGRFVTASPLQGGPVRSLASGTDPNALLAVGHDSGLISILDADGRRIAAPPAAASTVTAFDRDGRMLVTGQLNRVRAQSLRLLKPSAGPVRNPDRSESLAPEYTEVLTLKPDPAWWGDAAEFFTNDAVLTRDLAVTAGQEPASAGGRGVVLVWDARTGRPVQRLPFPGGQPDLANNVRLVPELSALIARSNGGTVRVWSTRTWKLLFEKTVGQGGGMEIRPGTTTAVMPVRADRSGSPAGDQGRLAFLDLKKRALRVVKVPGSVYRLGYTPDGNTLATLSSDNRLRLLDGEGESRSESPEIALEAAPDDLAVEPSGRRVAVSVPNGEVLVYTIATGTLAMPPLRDVDGLRSVNLAWDPRSDLLAAGTMRIADGMKQGGRTNLWRTGRLTWTEQLCGLAGRDITSAEWERYIPEFDPETLCRRSS